MNRDEAFCLNPWHFERSDPAILALTGQMDGRPHHCDVRLRVGGGGGGGGGSNAARYVCPICQRTMGSFGGGRDQAAGAKADEAAGQGRLEWFLGSSNIYVYAIFLGFFNRFKGVWDVVWCH